MCAIIQRHPKSVTALAEAVGAPLPDHDDVASAPDSHPMQDGDTVYTDGTVRLLREGRPVFFVTVEMQRKFAREKYVTLHAYHGSGVRNTDAGGHLFVLSDKAPVTARFRTEDAARRTGLAFSASFHSGQDLRPLEDEKLPLGARALPAALANFSTDMPRTREMLGELNGSDQTLANLYLRAIVEEVPVTMLGEVLRPDMFDKLRQLEGFREYEAKVKAEVDVAIGARIAEAEAKVAGAEAKVAGAEAKAAGAEAKAAGAEAKAAGAEARVIKSVAGNLRDFLIIRGDAPSEYAIKTISACSDADVLEAWLKRAYAGETSGQLFPEPKPQAS
ncbi:MAG: hypothetical protein ACRDNW_24255 [Trebonia sp.]